MATADAAGVEVGAEAGAYATNDVKVFVGNLPYTMNHKELGKHFSHFGTVIGAKIIQDRQTNRSKGFGFVTYDDAAAATNAINRAAGTTLEGRELTVRLAATRGTGPVNAGGGPVEPDDLMTSLLASSRRGAAEAKRERQDNYTKTKTKTKDGGGKGGARAGWGSWG